MKHVLKQMQYGFAVIFMKRPVPCLLLVLSSPTGSWINGLQGSKETVISRLTHKVLEGGGGANGPCHFVFLLICEKLVKVKFLLF